MAKALDRLPGRPHKCIRCRELIVFARTVATERGRGGKAMPLDLVPDPAGNVAARWDGRSLYARVLAKDEGIDHTTEVLAMPHFATCGRKGEKDLVDGVEAFLRDIAEGGAQHG